MAAQGRIYWNELGQEIFALNGTDLELSAESVSSEWTYESVDEKCQESTAKERQRVRNWRLSYLLNKDVEQHGFRSRNERVSRRSNSSSSSASSSTSTGSSSSTGAASLEMSARERSLLKRQRDEGGNAQDEEIAEATPNLESRTQIGNLAWLDAEKKYRAVALVPAFLSLADVEALEVTARHTSVREINDRKGALAFKHRVWRFDLQLRALNPELYRRLMDLMVMADAGKWRRMAQKSVTVFPEVEFIDYDVDAEGGHCFIEPHVDNKSAVSLVAMLSPPEAYTGGRSCFRRTAGRSGHRELQLGQGDVVLFRGEKLVHWISPVTSGRRTILQIELSRV